MKIFFAVLGLIVGGGMGGFWPAVILATGGWLLGLWVQKSTASASTPAAPGQSVETGLPHAAPEHDDAVLRRQVAALAARVEALEIHLGIVSDAKATPVPEWEPAPPSPIAVDTALLTPETAQEQAVALAEPPPAEPVAASAPAETAPVEPAAEDSRGVPLEPVASLEPPSPVAPEPAAEPAPTPAYAPEPAPAGPSLLSRLISGNIVAKVGVVVLFLGVGFLLKFAYDRGMMPPELRLAGVAAIAAALFFIGWRLRERRHLYAMILQGAASGLAYLDVYFALKTYAFISPATGFGLFALLGVATTVAAVRQDAAVLAVLGLLGAFSAPILAATGSGNHVLLFSYYTLLNVFILAVSWFKAWRALNLTD
jgi:uncharacterized membrane protein